MTEYSVPKGVSLETLETVVVGWAAAGACVEPTYTSAVAEATDISDAVGRQTRFLESVGVLERDGQRHRLTDAGQALAGALMADDDTVVAERARAVLADWGLTRSIRGVLRENQMPADDLVRVVAALAERDLDDDRVRSGITTLLDLFERAALVERVDDTYRLPPSDRPDSGERDAGFTPDAGGADADERPVTSSDGVEAEPATGSTEPGEGTTDSAVAVPAVRVTDGESPAVEFVELDGASEITTDALGPFADALAGAVDVSGGASPAVDAAGAVSEDDTPLLATTGANDGVDETGAHALSLDVDIDADAEDLEAIVAAVRRGLLARDQRP